MDTRLSDAQVEKMTNEGLSIKGIRYIEQTVDLTRIENVNNINFIVVYLLVTATLMLYSWIFSDEFTTRIAVIMTLISPVIFLINSFNHFDKLKDSPRITASERNIRLLFSSDLNLKKSGNLRRSVLLFSLGVSFICLLKLGSFWEIFLFLFLLFVLTAISVSLMVKNRKLLVDTINQQAEVIRL